LERRDAKGIKQVLRSETQIIGTLTRTAWTGPEDHDGLVAMQRQYRIRPLSEYTEIGHRRRRQFINFRLGTKRAPIRSASSTT